MAEQVSAAPRSKTMQIQCRRRSGSRDPLRQPHAGRESRCGLCEVVARLRGDGARPVGGDRRRCDGLRARGSPVGGAADRAGPGLADGRADQEPGRIRLRPAADPVDRGAGREPVRRREADRVRDRAPRRGRGAARAPEDDDAGGDRGGAGRGDGRRRSGGGDARTRDGDARTRDGRIRPPPRRMLPPRFRRRPRTRPAPTSRVRLPSRPRC